jgi:hypothetical protein
MLSEEQASLLNRLIIAEKYFSKRYPNKLIAAQRFYNQENYGCCKELLDELPTQEQMMDELIHRLEGKSIYKTIIEVQRGGCTNKFTKIKMISSLITHVCIECEKDGSDQQYSYLLPWLYDQLSKELYN